MQAKQQQDLEKILSRFTAKHSLCISHETLPLFEKLKSLHHYTASGFLSDSTIVGTQFDYQSWPFPGNTFELLLLHNVFTDQNRDHIAEILQESLRVVTEDGYLLIVQSNAIPLKDISKYLLKLPLQKLDSYYYDGFSLYQINSWFAYVLPFFYSRQFSICFCKKTTPLSPIFNLAENVKNMRRKYVPNNISNKTYKLRQK